MYIRNLRKASPNKSVLKFSKTNTNETVMSEGTIDFDACFHHNFNENIIYFDSQPEGFKYIFEGKELPYTPDVFIIYKDNTKQYIEYKPKKQAQKEEFIQKFKAKRVASRELGIPLILVTDKHVRQKTLLKNLKLLHRYSSFTESTELQSQILEIIKESKIIELQAITEKFNESIGYIRANIIQLLARNEISVDLKKDDLEKTQTFYLCNDNNYNFKDEFDEVVGSDPIPTPKQYIPLEKSVLITRDLDSYSTELKEQALERFRIISLLQTKLKSGWTKKNIKPILAELYSGQTKKIPSWRTVVRWRKRFQESNGEITSLIDKHALKGNTTRRTTGDEEFFKIALERYLKATRPSIMKAYEHYCDLITIENNNIVEGKIPKISYKSFNRRIKKLPPYPVAVARYGKYLADRMFEKCLSHIRPTRILERVEIDHTPLDLILVDDELNVPLGRPYLTLLVDVFSNCVVGFHISYKAPSYVSVTKAIVHAISPKDYIDDLGADLIHSWPCHGKIETLVVDNGAEFWSQSLEHACNEAKINIQYNPVRKPWLKPYIEGFFDAINKLLLTDLDGKTFCNILQKADYKPEKDAVIKFSDFIREFHRWIVDIHHYKPNAMKTSIPILNWQRSYDVLPPLNMSDEEIEHLKVIMFIKEERTLYSKGIKYKDLRYDSRALSDYRKQYVPDKYDKEKRKKIIKVDPDDLSRIYVYLDEYGKYLEVPCTETSGYTLNLSLYRHLLYKKVMRLDVDENADEYSLALARQKLFDNLHKVEKEDTRKLKDIKQKARLADVSNTGTGSIALLEESKPVVTSKAPLVSFYDDIEDEDDLEGF